MNELTIKQKTDVGLFLVSLFICVPLLLFIRTNSEIKEIQFTHNQAQCKPYKNSRYKGYFIVDGEEFSVSGRGYNSCQDFKTLVQGKEIYAQYLGSNNVIIELKINGKALVENTKTKLVYFGLFFAFLVFSFIRKPVHKLVDKYV